VPLEEVRLYLALRECAHQRLFAHVPWLRARLFGAVEDYARGIVVDPSRLEEVMRSVDPSSPEAVQDALQSGMFEPEDTPAQKAALARLETLLALVEGWVDAVVTDAAHALPSADAMRETVRRVRATGGPAEQTFSTLVGLELRPRRLREAATLWTELERTRGVDGRDAVWAHAELLPTADDLDDPAGFASRDELDLSALEGMPPAEPDAGSTDTDGEDDDPKRDDRTDGDGDGAGGPA
jgi:putative hydrolase